MLKKLWMDEGGALLSAELALLGTVVVIALVVGASALSDSINSELADLGAAIGALDQSYTNNANAGHSAATAPSGFTDADDQCEGGSTTSNLCLSVASGTTITAPTQGDTGN